MSWKCKQCGLCCKLLLMNLDTALSEEEMKFFNSRQHVWAVNEHLLVTESKCKHLGFKNGKHFCKIYNNRPNWCREAEEEQCKNCHIIKEAIDQKKKIRGVKNGVEV